MYCASLRITDGQRLFSFNFKFSLLPVRLLGNGIVALFAGDVGKIGLGGGEMKLLPREIEKLELHQAGFLAQKRLARGIRLNYTEAVALIATQVLHYSSISFTIFMVCNS